MPAVGTMVAWALALTTLASCELLIGVDDRPEYVGGGGSTGSGGGTGGTSSGGGHGGTSSGGGQGGGTDCPAAPAGCGPDPAPAVKWPDSTPLCYGNKPPPCDYPGEDGDIDGTRGYDAANGIITDTVTHLEWLQGATDALNWNQADSHCDQTHLGLSGWRLPTLMELLTLIDYGRVPLIHGEFDVGAPTSHWTAEEGATPGWHYLLLFNDEKGLWDFIGGELTWGGELLVVTHVRCVRGPEITGPRTTVTDCAPHLVRDSRTGLEWQRVPADQQLSWTEALAHCAGLCDNGGGWRLASAKELSTLYVAGPAPTIIEPFAPPGGAEMAEFWTSTPCPTLSGAAFVVDFAPADAWDYSVRRDPAATLHRPWCVRSYSAP